MERDENLFGETNHGAYKYKSQYDAVTRNSKVRGLSNKCYSHSQGERVRAEVESMKGMSSFPAVFPGLSATLISF